MVRWVEGVEVERSSTEGRAEVGGATVGMGAEGVVGRLEGVVGSGVRISWGVSAA